MMYLSFKIFNNVLIIFSGRLEIEYQAPLDVMLAIQYADCVEDALKSVAETNKLDNLKWNFKSLIGKGVKVINEGDGEIKNLQRMEDENYEEIANT